MAVSRPRWERALGREPATSARPPVFAKPTTSEEANNTFCPAELAIDESGTYTLARRQPGVQRVPNALRYGPKATLTLILCGSLGNPSCPAD